ncbi:MAG: TIGR03960 family radical SAM protein [Clostridiales bacterium]|nr:MAG: TIGR03960 family radical SAM protein [Clostridiales bacterium]
MDINTFIDTYLTKIQKPAHYSGGEYGAVIKEDVDVRFAFCFPDTYDIGMSHLGMKILYHMMNDMEMVACERVFTPNVDMEQAMRENDVPLYSLETRKPVGEFDFVGFTLQYELSYTNILTMLDLAKIPLLATDRKNENPIVICGGPCACNPEPLADFVDIFFIGEGEEFYTPLFDLYRKHKGDREAFLKAASELECMYVPAYHDKNRKVTRAIIKDIDKVYYPKDFVVPCAEIVHDRIMLEIMRGCIRGCRFCQAGMIYRPYRQKSPETLVKQAIELCKNTGYDEISLTSLSTSDFEKLPELADSLLEYCLPQQINLSLPSLRVDNFTKEILEKTQAVRKSGLTFAPEAGTQRLRDVINKNVTEEDIMNTCRIAFESGTSAVKLYFMIGLPTETDEDIAGIAHTAERILHLFATMPETKGRGLQITISLSTFVPKPFTPFQWEPQITLEEIERKQKYLLSLIKTRKIKLNYHDGTKSVLEGVFARGDRRLGKALLLAWQKGCKLDGWDNHFKFDTWMESIKEAGLTPEEYANRQRDFDEELPWDVINIGVTKEFLIRECKKAYKAKTTPNCKEQCSGCGVNKLCKGDVCNAY